MGEWQELKRTRCRGGGEGWVILGLVVLIVGVVLSAFVLGNRLGRSQDSPTTSPNPKQEPRSDRAPHAGSQHPSDEEFNFDSEWTKTLVLIGQDTPGMRLSAEIKGGGTEQSEYFDVVAGDQDVVWALDPKAEVRMLTVSIRDRSGRHVDQFIPDTKSRILGHTRLRLKPGTYYLDVTAFGQWRVAIIERP